MVFSSSEFELNRRAQHWHGGDDWGDMQEVTPSHDSAESDPERGWKVGRIFRCASCDQQFRVLEPTDTSAGR